MRDVTGSGIASVEVVSTPDTLRTNSDGSPRWRTSARFRAAMHFRRVSADAVREVINRPLFRGVCLDGTEWRIGNPIDDARRVWIKVVASAAERVLLTVYKPRRVPRAFDGTRFTAAGNAGRRLAAMVLLLALGAVARADGAARPAGAAPPAQPSHPVAPAPAPALPPRPAVVAPPTSYTSPPRRGVPWTTLGVLVLGSAASVAGGIVIGRRLHAATVREAQERREKFVEVEDAARRRFRNVVLTLEDPPSHALAAFKDARAGQGFPPQPSSEECLRALDVEAARRRRAVVIASCVGTLVVLAIVAAAVVWLS